MRYSFYRGPDLAPIWTIIAVNLLVLIASMISDNVTYTLGLVPVIFLERPWTIITNLFVHSGFWHFFGNMITLFFFGGYLSNLVGSRKFLLLYFIGGILGNAVYLLLGEPYSIAVGASGAVYAVAGALVVLVPRLKVMLYFVFPLPLWAVILFFYVVWSFIPGVAWQAHLGGLAAGIVAGFIFKRKLRYY